MAGYGIADENHFGLHYWMLDVDMTASRHLTTAWATGGSS
jgi:hypothetical protein